MDHKCIQNCKNVPPYYNMPSINCVHVIRNQSSKSPYYNMPSVNTVHVIRNQINVGMKQIEI